MEWWSTGAENEEDLKWQACLNDDLWGSYTKTKDVKRLEKDGEYYFRILCLETLVLWRYGRRTTGEYCNLSVFDYCFAIAFTSES